MDVSSEMIHSLLLLFMVTTLSTGAIAVGIMEGLAESFALVVKVFSGALSDYLGRRKPLALFGYSLSALTKPIFAMASCLGLVVTARLLDLVGKGLRGAARERASYSTTLFPLRLQACRLFKSYRVASNQCG